MINTQDKRPNFLGIGAQKSATRWLYNQLKRHPDIYLTPIKELHYFDQLRNIKSYSGRLNSPVWSKNFGKFPIGGSQEKDWNVNFFMEEYSDDWYSKLFSKAGQRLAGEITPEYSILSTSDIRIIKEINPDLRIIYLLRNPVDRAWSHFRMYVTRSRQDFNKMTEKQVFKFIGSTNCFEKGNYLDNLKRWYEVFNREQMFIGYLEEVINEPEKLMKEILIHLGADSTVKRGKKSYQMASNVGNQIPMDLKYKEFLKEKYFEHNEGLYKLLGNPIIKKWNKK